MFAKIVLALVILQSFNVRFLFAFLFSKAAAKLVLIFCFANVFELFLLFFELSSFLLFSKAVAKLVLIFYFANVFRTFLFCFFEKRLQS